MYVPFKQIRTVCHVTLFCPSPLHWWGPFVSLSSQWLAQLTNSQHFCAIFGRPATDLSTTDGLFIGILERVDGRGQTGSDRPAGEGSMRQGETGRAGRAETRGNAIEKLPDNWQYWPPSVVQNYEYL